MPGTVNNYCQSIAQMSALEDLYVASENIHDEGVAALARLKHLKRLQISAAASEAAIADLQQQLPDCEIDFSGYRNQ